MSKIRLYTVQGKELKDKIAKRNDKVYFIPNKKNLVYPFFTNCDKMFLGGNGYGF